MTTSATGSWRRRSWIGCFTTARSCTSKEVPIASKTALPMMPQRRWHPAEWPSFSPDRGLLDRRRLHVCYLPVLALLVTRPKTRHQLRFYCTKRRASCITVLGMNDTFGTLCVFSAYRLGRNAAQLDPLLGITTIVSVMLAIVLLREREHLPGKLLGALVTVVGAVLVL
jgi:uncharacterized membrane protein